MPIRLNLLAEVQAAEEVRRRDPVKRVIWGAALLVCLMLAWWSSLVAKTVLDNNDLSKIEAQISSAKPEYQSIIDGQKKAGEITRKLASLQQLATNRFLQGSTMNALQQSTVDKVRLLRFRVDQSYAFTDEVKPRRDGERTIPGKPATATERIVLTFDAKDSSANPGDYIGKFREVIASNDYFKGKLGATNEVMLTKYSPPQGAPGEAAFVLFTVQCELPEKTR